MAAHSTDASAGVQAGASRPVQTADVRLKCEGTLTSPTVRRMASGHGFRLLAASMRVSKRREHTSGFAPPRVRPGPGCRQPRCGGECGLVDEETVMAIQFVARLSGVAENVLSRELGCSAEFCFSCIDNIAMADGVIF